MFCIIGWGSATHDCNANHVTVTHHILHVHLTHYCYKLNQYYSAVGVASPGQNIQHMWQLFIYYKSTRSELAPLAHFLHLYCKYSNSVQSCIVREMGVDKSIVALEIFCSHWFSECREGMLCMELRWKWEAGGQQWRAECIFLVGSPHRARSSFCNHQGRLSLLMRRLWWWCGAAYSIEGGQHLNSIIAKQLGDSGGVVADYNDSYDNKPNVEERVAN